MKLSVIIYLNNTKKEELKRCIDSIYPSSVREIETIIIDDGSTENYSEILEKCHPVYVKTQYRGALASKLYALTIAKGEYVAFLDSRDTVSFNYYASMVSEAENGKFDAVINDYAVRENEAYAFCRKDSLLFEDNCTDGKSILEKYSALPSCYMLGNKIFRKELLLNAKREMEKTDIIMKRCNGISDSVICIFALKNAQNVKNIHTGYCFFEIAGAGCSVSNVDEETGALTTLEQCADTAIAAAWVSRARDAFARRGESLQGDGFLGNKLEGVDTIIRWICKKGEDVSVFYSKNDEYAAKLIAELDCGFGIKVRNEKNAQLTIPERKAGLFDKLLHKKYVKDVDTSLLQR